MNFQPQISRSFRRSIAIHISQKGEVIVKAPRFVSDKIIQQFLDEKEDWIKKTLEKVVKRKIEKKRFEEGERFLFLGVSKRLTFYDGIEIFIKGEYLYFPKAMRIRAKKELESWYKKQAQTLISQRLLKKAEEVQASFTNVFFSDTKSKWGTCFADNTLQFNWRLIMAPLMVVDYVVIHELVHTTEKNHSDKFWRKVRLFTPAYKQHRKWLNENGDSLLF